MINCGYVLHYNSINLFLIIAVMFREGQAPPLQNFPTQKSAICNKQRIIYIQFSALVKMVSGSKAIMFYGAHTNPIVTALRTIPRKTLSLLPYERSVGFASLRNSGRSTSGIHARPLSKVRCCRPKKFGRLPEGLYSVSTIILIDII